MAIDEAKLQAFMGQVVGDFGATVSSALVVIGDKLGLYKSMAGAGPLTSTELAQRTGTAERYVREWLMNQAAGGYVEYDAATGRYCLPEEQALALADEDSPLFVAGGFQVLTAMMKAAPRITEAFRTGGGMAWGDHDPDLFEGTERFFRPGYGANLVASWIPALQGVAAKLEVGATVADVGCGYGASTIILAKAYPRSRFFGFDSHPASIERAKVAAEAAGVSDRVIFDQAGAADYPGGLYDLVAFFDCLHDLPDPIGAMGHTRAALAPEGTVLLVEPMAGEQVEDNLNPIGRTFSAGSTLCCIPHSLATGGLGLGSTVSERQLHEVVTAGGFTRFQRVTQTPFNRVYEVRS